MPENQLYNIRPSELYNLFWNSRFTDPWQMYWNEHYVKWVTHFADSLLHELHMHDTNLYVLHPDSFPFVLLTACLWKFITDQHPCYQLLMFALSKYLLMLNAAAWAAVCTLIS